MNKKMVIAVVFLITVSLFAILKLCPTSIVGIKNQKIMMGMLKDEGKIEKMGAKFASILNFNLSQKEYFINEANKLKEESAVYQKNIENLQMEIRSEFKKDDPNKEMIYSCMDKISNEKMIIQKKKVNFMLNVHSKLTPDQKKIFKKFFD